MGRPLDQWQIVTPDPERHSAFYSELFGWTIDGDNPLGYRQVGSSDAGVEGGFWPAPPEASAFCQLFFTVDDADAALQRATELDSQIIVPLQVLPDGGRMAVLRDPLGVSFGIHQRA